MKWNEKCNDLKCVQKPTQSRPCKQVQPLSRKKTLNCPRVRGISPVRKEKVYGGNDLPKSQVLSSGWKIERVREDASGDLHDHHLHLTLSHMAVHHHHLHHFHDGEDDDDELPCVIDESEGDCVWRGSRISVRSSFHRQGIWPRPISGHIFISSPLFRIWPTDMRPDFTIFWYICLTVSVRTSSIFSQIRQFAPL